MYPSSSYNYGNPGYYYDSLQFPVSTETQTSPTYVPPQDHYVPPTGPTHVLDPSLNTGVPPCQVNFTTEIPPPLSSNVRSDEHSTNNAYHYYQDIGDDYGSFSGNNLQPSRQTMDQGSIHTSPLPPHYQDAGCQVISPSSHNPITMVKDVKKLTFPYFDPTKMTWTSFAMNFMLHLLNAICHIYYESNLLPI
jgi:hypothetical protein